MASEVLDIKDRVVLSIKGVNHWFGRHRVLFDVSLDIVRGEIVGLVGPSGCGKSTLLRAIVGTHPPCSGEIRVCSGGPGAGALVRGPGRDRGIVYQQYSLFPFLTAQENVAFGLMVDESSIPYRLLMYPKWRKMRAHHMELAAEFLKRVDLGHAMRLYPGNMSGGMRQRVAVAQALIMKPEIILLDEPFGALDEATREDLQCMLLSLYQENLDARREKRKPPYTILIVTHELNEAIYVGDRVAGLSQWWDWKSEGFDECPGATIVYDRPAPVEEPGGERKYEVYAEQRREIRRTVFDPPGPVDRRRAQTFWEELDNPENRRGVLR
ncbi:MAG TPA: ATP-binding cassette domain-containing protein [Candidatus Bathyarchaeia archaeon]|nr:ATP-binding cassette domain-containing protein [Candidatus Bathyarchaeia archaeon]